MFILVPMNNGWKDKYLNTYNDLGNAAYNKYISKYPFLNNHATFSFSVSLYSNVFVQKHFLAHKFDSFKFYVGINYKL